MRKGLTQKLGRNYDFLCKHQRGFITFIIFALVYGFILINLDIKTVFTNTHLTGGDLGSHVYVVEYLKQIFPHIRWWSPDWFSGFPFLFFYPPLLYIITVIFGYIIPLNVALKIVVFSIILAFPLAFYFPLKWLDMRFPAPQLGAVFSLFLLFLDKYNIYGGNLASLTSGEFSYTLSILLIFMFIGLMYKGMTEKKYLIWNCLVGTAVMLTHPIAGMLLIPLALAFPFQTKDLKSGIKYTAFVYVGIFLLSAWWSLGVLFYHGDYGTMSWTANISLGELLPDYWLPLLITAALGIGWAICNKERKLIPFFTLAWVSLLLYLSLTNTMVWNTRFLPYISFAILFLAAYFLAIALNYLKKKYLKIFFLTLAAVLAISFYGVSLHLEPAISWFKTDFRGFEKMAAWPEASDLFAYLKTLPKGRVMWEHRPEFKKYGTTRTLENIPLFSDQPTFEGLLVESSPSAPFVFINQAETTTTPMSGVAGLDLPPYNFEKGIRHLAMSGARYFVAYSEKVKSDADRSPELKKPKKIGPFNVYEFKKVQLVEPVKDFKVVNKNKYWLAQSINWYKNGDLNQPIVFAQGNKEAKYLKTIKSESDPNIPKNIKQTNDSLEFDTPNIGQPYIVKVSYFPTWRVKGAKGPFLVSPSYMLIVPTTKHVKLYFSYGLTDWVGAILGITSLGYLIWLMNISKQPKK